MSKQQHNHPIAGNRKKPRSICPPKKNQTITLILLLKMRPQLTAFLLLLAAIPLRANVKLPAIFGDHMVLQRDMKVPVWGWADPHESVTVTAGAIKATSTAGADGIWSVNLVGLKASDQPIDLVVTGKNTVTFHDVLVGDVWLCSGQSNMGFGLREAHNASEEIPKADFPTLRRFAVAGKMIREPQSDCIGKWELTTPKNAGACSAVSYFFGKEILKDQKVPVGMIISSKAGTQVELWISAEALKSNPALSIYVKKLEKYLESLQELTQQYQTDILPKWQKEHDDWLAQGGKSSKPSKPEPKRPQDPETVVVPTVLFNGMIAPLVRYAIKGVIWYQGEGNVGSAALYQTLFPVLIQDWRARWGEGDFPFIWVQLANRLPREPEPTQTVDGWHALREAQLKTLKLPNTAQVVTVDIGEADTSHPLDKLDVGLRLSLAARHIAYGENLVYSGPVYDSFKVEGNQIRVKFKEIGSGLIIGTAPPIRLGVPPGQPAAELKGFSIAGADQKFVWATAKIDGDCVIVSSPEVKDPKAVRYGWANNPEVNLYNKENLPASPFRTDDWNRKP